MLSRIMLSALGAMGFIILAFKFEDMQKPGFYETMISRFSEVGINIEIGTQTSLESKRMTHTKICIFARREYKVSRGVYVWLLTQYRTRNSTGHAPTVVVINKWKRTISLLVE